MDGRGRRRKGHQFERDLKQQWRAIGYKDAITTREANGGGRKTDNGIDLQNTGIYKVQAKRWEKYYKIEGVFEPKCGPGDVPVLFTKADFMPTLSVLPADHLMRLISDSAELAALRRAEAERTLLP